MALFFGGKKLKDTGILTNATDWHCHVLPGVDDGIRRMEDTLKALSIYEEAGFAEIWFTPHIMEECPNTTDELRQKFEEVKAAYNGPLQLHLASENMLDGFFEKRLETNDFLPIGNDGKHLLVETSYFSSPVNFFELLEQIKAKGYWPILAHPERYVYMDKRWYDELISRNIKLQLNIFSMQGAYGDEAKAKAKWLHKNGYYTIFGTDTHRQEQLKHYVNTKFPEKELKMNGI